VVEGFGGRCGSFLTAVLLERPGMSAQWSGLGLIKVLTDFSFLLHVGTTGTSPTAVTVTCNRTGAAWPAQQNSSFSFDLQATTDAGACGSVSDVDTGTVDVRLEPFIEVIPGGSDSLEVCSDGVSAELTLTVTSTVAGPFTVAFTDSEDGDDAAAIACVVAPGSPPLVFEGEAASP